MRGFQSLVVGVRVKGFAVVHTGTGEELGRAVAQGGRFADMYAAWVAHLNPRRTDL